MAVLHNPKRYIRGASDVGPQCGPYEKMAFDHKLHSLSLTCGYHSQRSFAAHCSSVPPRDMRNKMERTRFYRNTLLAHSAGIGCTRVHTFCYACLTAPEWARCVSWRMPYDVSSAM